MVAFRVFKKNSVFRRLKKYRINSKKIQLGMKGEITMTRERLSNVLETEVAEFESQLLEVMKAAQKGDEKSIEIILKMKKAIGSF